MRVLQAFPGDVPNQEKHFSCSEMQSKAIGTDPELQESDVTTLASPHSTVIILKAMRPSIRADWSHAPVNIRVCGQGWEQIL